MILLHDFIKKSDKTPRDDLDTAIAREKKFITIGENMKSENKHIGSDFDDFLREEGILGEAESFAVKRVIAYQIEEEMKRRNITKLKMAKQMHTSRSSIDRLFDPENNSVTLLTLNKAAAALGKKLKIELV